MLNNVKFLYRALYSLKIELPVIACLLLPNCPRECFISSGIELSSADRNLFLTLTTYPNKKRRSRIFYFAFLSVNFHFAYNNKDVAGFHYKLNSESLSVVS